MLDSQDSQSQISKELDRTASVFGTEEKFFNKLSIFRPKNLQVTFNSIAFVLSRVKQLIYAIPYL